MSGDLTTPGRLVLARQRAWAWTGLAALAGLAVAAAAVLVRSEGSLIALVLAGVLDLLLAAAASWWAFTTRRAWKRWLNLTLVVLVIVAFVVVLVVFSLGNAVGVLAVVVTGMVYGLASRRVLNDDGPAATAEPAARPSVRPWLLVNPRSGDGMAGRVDLANHARALGVSVHELAPGEDPATLARDAVAAGADAVGVAGGDGSLGSIAKVAVELDVPFVCVPAGTRTTSPTTLGSTGPTPWPP